MQRPWNPPGIGWLIAVVVVIFALLAIVAHLEINPWWGILALAVAILV